MITHGTPSRLDTYERCPHRAWLKYDQKIPEPDRDDSPLVRGEEVHDNIEKYIRADTDTIPVEDDGIMETIDWLRTAYPTGYVQMEQMWTVDDTWVALPDRPDWSQVYFGVKLDAFHYAPFGDHTAYVFDWKTGKKDGNEVKHGDQMFCYGLLTLLRYPTIEELYVELVYTDLGKRTTKRMTRRKLARLPWLQGRIARMQKDPNYFPKPSTHNCMWCPYKTGTMGSKNKPGPEGTGHCQHNLAVGG